MDPCFEFKPSAERFEQGMKAKMIMKRIMKALLKSKRIYDFELIYSQDLVSGIIGLSVFLLTRQCSLLLKPNFWF